MHVCMWLYTLGSMNTGDGRMLEKDFVDGVEEAAQSWARSAGERSIAHRGDGSECE